MTRQPRIWMVVLAVLAFALGACRGPDSTAPTPTSVPVLLTPPSEVAVPEVPGAEPLPVEPWKDVNRAEWQPAYIRTVVAFWYPPILQVVVEGDLPTPCHTLHAGLYPETAPGVVDLRLMVEPPPPDKICVQVLQPFKVVINLQPPVPPVRVLVNGKAAFIGR